MSAMVCLPGRCSGLSTQPILASTAAMSKDRSPLGKNRRKDRGYPKLRSLFWLERARVFICRSAERERPGRGFCPAALSGNPIETGFEVALAPQADQLFGDLALFEQQQRGNRANTVLSREFLVLVDV